MANKHISRPPPSRIAPSRLTGLKCLSSSLPQPLRHGATVREARANVAHTTQSRPYSGLGFQVKALKTCLIVLSSLVGG